MMEEEIIPPLKAALEGEEDVSQVELSFQNNTVRPLDWPLHILALKIVIWRCYCTFVSVKVNQERTDLHTTSRVRISNTPSVS